MYNYACLLKVHTALAQSKDYVENMKLIVTIFGDYIGNWKIVIITNTILQEIRKI